MYRFLQDHPRLGRLLDIVGAIVLVNIVAVLCAIPLVTLPVVVAATFSYMTRVALNANVDLGKSFFGVFRPLFVSSWLIVLISVVIWGGTAATYFIVRAGTIPLGGVAASLWFVVAFAWLLVSFYLWPALVLIDRPFGELVWLAARLAFGHLPWSLVLFVAVAAIAWLSLHVPILFALGTFSGSALLIGWGAWRVLRGYIVTPPA